MIIVIDRTQITAQELKLCLLAIIFAQFEQPPKTKMSDVPVHQGRFYVKMKESYWGEAAGIDEDLQTSSADVKKFDHQFLLTNGVLEAS